MSKLPDKSHGQVAHPNGLVLNHPSVRVPRGTVLALPLEPIHRDEAFYPNADQFDAFRFVRGTGGNADDPAVSDNFQGDKEADGGDKRSRPSVTLDGAFLGFGLASTRVLDAFLRSTR